MDVEDREQKYQKYLLLLVSIAQNHIFLAKY